LGDSDKYFGLGPRLKGCILLIDTGYFKYLFFDRIVRYGGYFVSRLKKMLTNTRIYVEQKSSPSKQTDC